MQTFHCVCGNTIFFKNTRCEACERRLAFLPDERRMSVVESAVGGRWNPPDVNYYRRCCNYRKFDICHWMVTVDDPESFSFSCGLTESACYQDVLSLRLYSYPLESSHP